MSIKQIISLVDYLAYKASCMYVSDLRYLDSFAKLRLTRVVEKVELNSYSLSEWNNALIYLGRVEPQETERAAKERLLALLNSER